MLRVAWASSASTVSVAVFALLASLACNRVETAPRPTPSGPNILLVTIDTLRADHVGAQRAGAAETPTLDALTTQGVRFSQAVATVPLTLPSHTSILTGLYPPHHGVRHNAIFEVRDETETVAERFQAAGYATGAVIGAAVLDAKFGIAQGFDFYDDEIDERRAASSGFFERPASEVTDKALTWLAQTDRPFFLWVHYYDVHAAYDPPEPHRSRMGKDLYAGEVAYVDAQVGRLLDGLRASGRLDRTVVSVTADHGEGLGEHGEASHSYLVYESVLHVPWILKGPGVPAGQSIDEVVSNAAVASTLLELAGLPSLAKADVASAVPMWAAAPKPGSGWAYAESLAGQLEFGWAPLYAIRTGREKFIEAPRAEYYDLAADPGERANLLDGKQAPQERVAAARDQIARARTGERQLDTVAVDAQTRAQVEALGYLVPTPGAAAQGSGEDPKDVHRSAAIAYEALGAYFAGDAVGAERLAKETLERMPNSVRAHEILARLYLQYSRPADALPHAKAAARLQPQFADYQATVGIAELALGNYPAAVQAFEAAAQIDGGSAGRHLGLMWRAKVGGSIEDAAEHADAALALDGERVATWDTIGEIWESVGEYERALDVYERATKRFPADPRLQMRLAIQYARLGDDAKSVAHLGAAKESARDGRLASRLAIVYAARGEHARAEPILRDLVARNPTSAARNYLARLLRETGRESEAAQLLEFQGGPPAAPAPILDGLAPQDIPHG